MIATPKHNGSIVGQCYGDYTGVSVEIKLAVGQKWSVRIRGGCYWLLRKGIKLRLTETALCRLFDLEE